MMHKRKIIMTDRGTVEKPDIHSELSEEQKEFIRKSVRERVPEQEVREKIGHIDEGELEAFLKNDPGIREAAVFRQKISSEELAAVSGGDEECASGKVDYHCKSEHHRYIYEDDFSNCANTVKEQSWCGKADACFESTVVYRGLQNCFKAWE